MALLWGAGCLGAGSVAPELLFYRAQKVTLGIGLAFCRPTPLKLAAPCCFAVASRLFGGWQHGSRACFLEASESDIRHWHSAALDLLKLAAPCRFAVASQLFGRWQRGSGACFLEASESDVRHWHSAAL